MPKTPSVELNKTGKLIRYCIRCGGEYKECGRILEYGKTYPRVVVVKMIDGKRQKVEIPADQEIKKALCLECSKETFIPVKIPTEEEIIETAEKIVIDYANLSGRESVNRADFRERVINHLKRLTAPQENTPATGKK